MTRTRMVLAAAAVAAVAALAACGAPAQGGDARVAPAVAPQAAAQAAPRPAAATCTESFAPGRSLAQLRDSQAVADIRARGRLIVGTSGDVLLWGARNPQNGQLDGFDIRMAQEISKAIFGGKVQVEYRVINYGQRIPSLVDNSVDLVLHTMTINCDRWKQINFSAEYYAAGQKLLVRNDGPKSIDALAAENKTVCVPAASTNEEYLRTTFPQLRRVAVADVGECLVRFQQGEIDAITGDDTVLAGFAAQDPYAQVVGAALTAEPYGIGVNKGEPDLARFVNAVLESVKADGTWAKIYAGTMGTAVEGGTPRPPAAKYGR